MRSAPFLAALALAACAPLSAPRSEEAAEERHPGGLLHRYQQRLDEDGRIAFGAALRAKRQRDAMLAAPEAAGGNDPQWRWLGPGNVGGRVRGILIHPANPNILWCGAATGGVWKSTDAGASWQPLNDFLANLNIGCMAMDPANPDRLYVGTGEGFFEDTAGASNTSALQGAGIFVSDDGGVHWSQMASTNTPDWVFVNRIAIDPNNPQHMLAATGTGIWWTNNGGGNWNRRTSGRTLDVDFHPTDGNLAVAGRNGVAQYSTDGGVNWFSAILPANTERVELAYAPSSPNIVYAAVTESSSGDIFVWKSVDGGQRYTRQTSGSGINTWSFYTGALWVSPADPNLVVFGGVQHLPQHQRRCELQRHQHRRARRLPRDRRAPGLQRDDQPHGVRRQRRRRLPAIRHPRFDPVGGPQQRARHHAVLRRCREPGFRRRHRRNPGQRHRALRWQRAQLDAHFRGGRRLLRRGSPRPERVLRRDLLPAYLPKRRRRADRELHPQPQQQQHQRPQQLHSVPGAGSQRREPPARRRVAPVADQQRQGRRARLVRHQAAHLVYGDRAAAAAERSLPREQPVATSRRSLSRSATRI